MGNPTKTESEQIEEIEALKKKVLQLEQSVREHKRVEAELRLFKEQQELLINGCPDFFFLKDLTLRYQLINDSNAKFFGREVADILGKTDMELMPEEVAASCRESDLKAIRTGKAVVTIEPAADRVYETRKFPAIIGGEIVGVAGIVRDITEQQHVLGVLKQSASLLSAALESTADGLLIVEHATGRIAGYNRKFLELWHIPEPVAEAGNDAELLESVLSQLKHPDAFLEKVASLYADPEVQSFDTIEFKDGRVFERYSQPQKIGSLVVGRVWSFRDVTERKRAEDALRESENRLRIILDSVQTGIVIVDPETHRIVHANPAALNMIGASAEKVEGSVCHQFICPAEEGQCPITDLRQIIDNSERVLLTAMGETRSIIKTVAHVTLNNRTHLLESFVDITERKRAEDALRASHQRVLDIIEFLPDPTFVIDRDRKVVAWNKAIEEMTGVRKKDIVGKGDYSYATAFYGNPRPVLVDLVFERREGDAKEHDNLVRRAGILVAEEYVPLIGRGKKAYLSIMASPLFDPEGNVVGAIESVRDITEQKRVEEELQESEERYRTAIESSDDGIAMIKEGRHLYVNRRYLEIFGLSCVDEALGQPVGFMVHPDDYERVTEIAGQRQRNEEAPRRYEFKALKANGDTAFIDVSATRSAFKGEPIVLAYLRDVTARKHLEAQLLQSQKMEAIGTLAGGIAHDFNNILTAVIGYSSLVRMKMEPDSVLKVYLDQILSSSQKAAQLTQNLLAFSRKQAIELKAKKVGAMVRESEKLLKRLLMENIEFKLSLAAPDVTIMADPIQIDQVLMNLAANARDAMPQGGSFTITTSAICLDEQFSKAHGFGEPGDYAVISVIDSGAGINPQILAKVFEPFFTTKEVGKGTGLGLSTVYGIVKQHNGYITVQSSPGEGTTFTIYFPRIYVSVGRERSAPYKIEKGNETVLVAEDDEEVRGLLKEILEGSGYTVLEAVDGEDAVVQFRLHGKIDLLIIDSVMPRKNGREAYNEIRMMSPGVKAILTSGYAEEIVLGDGIEDSNLSFVSKPISPNELLHKVRVILDK